MNKNSSFVPLRLLAVGLILASVTGATAGTLKEASVTESVNTVSYQRTSDAAQKSAGVGTTIYPNNIVRTGVKSRAELQFNDKTVTRIGANSAFSFDSDKQAINLQQGTALFSKPKDNSAFEITTPAATCSISGTTGFMEVKPGRDKAHTLFIFGLIEGHTSVTIAGKIYKVGPGQLLVRTANGSVTFVSFNIPKFLHNAGLITDFKSELPNQVDIERAEARFVSLQERGFIEPTAFSIGTNDNLIGFYTEARGDYQTFAGLTQQVNLGSQVATFQNQAVAQAVLAAAGPGGNGGGGFVNVGGTGEIRGQLVWNVYADLDLHLILPNGAGEVYYGNSTITFNNGAATARLDHDNVGPIIDVQPTARVENIVITGTPAAGNYSFFVHDFSSSGPVTYTLTTTVNNGATTQVQNGTLTGTGANGATITVPHS